MLNLSLNDVSRDVTASKFMDDDALEKEQAHA
jgi:hypothetical protein